MLLKPSHIAINLKKTLQITYLANFSSLTGSKKKSPHLNLTNNKAKHLCPNNITLNYLLHKNNYPITTHKFPQSMIESLQEYIRGSEMLEKGQYAVAITQFQMALKFLPKTVLGDNANNYQVQYQSLVKKYSLCQTIYRLLQAHVMTNKSLKSFTQTYKDYLSQSTPLSQLISTLLKIQQNHFQSLRIQQPPEKLWKQLVRAFAFRQSKDCFGKHVPIEKVKETKDLALKYVGLFLYEKIKARKNKQRESIYLDTCRQLLKQTQQFQPSNIVKPLSLMSCNLLAGQQYLQAQGLMSHCLSVLEQFYHHSPIYLKTDQEYIMCKLLIARVFEGVKRTEECKKIREEYEGLFDEKKLFIQEMVRVAYREL